MHYSSSSSSSSSSSPSSPVETMEISVKSLSMSSPDSDSSPSAKDDVEAEAEASDAHETNVGGLPTFAKKVIGSIRGFRPQKDPSPSPSRSRSRSRERADDSNPVSTTAVGLGVNTASGEIRANLFATLESADESTRDVKGGADHKRAKVLVVDDTQADKPMDLDFDNLNQGSQTSLSTAAAAVQKGTYIPPVGKNLKR